MSTRSSAGDGIVVSPVQDKAGRDRFIRVPWSIFRNDPHWVPPLMMERRDHLDPGKNPYFAHAEARFWIAARGGRPVSAVAE